MLDIQYIREHQDEIRAAITNKHLTIDLDQFLSLDAERRALLQTLEELQSLKNDINSLVIQAKSPEEKAEIIAKGKEIKQKLDEYEPQYQALKEKYDGLMALIPNPTSPDTPIGPSEAENVVVYEHGEKPTFAFTPKTHIELGKSLDIIDFERGVKVSGYRGYYLKNDGALLVMALMQYAFRKMAEQGFTPFIPPTLIKGFPLFGSGYFKSTQYNSDVDEVYQVAADEKNADGSSSNEEKFLVGTAEPSLLAYYAGEVLNGASLPLKLVGFSQCYRSEIGSYGKDTKGLYRVHEFFKVEQVVLAPADRELTNELQEEMLSLTESMHRELGLPYRKLIICTGDLGSGKYRQFDIEAWMPGLERYGETGSASNFLDWQARRLNVKYRDEKTGKKQFVYMLNNTALPSPRILIALLENHQQADGSIIIPEVLRPLMGKDKIEVKM